jgi:hypothetical protein
MNPSARVTSVEALAELKAALCLFQEKAQAALCSADAEVRRVVDVLADDLARWQNAVRQQQEELNRAKATLAQRRWGHQDGRGPGTTEAEMAVKEAQRRLRYAEEKVETVRRWQRVLPQAVHEYTGPTRVLAGMLDADLRHAIALLDGRVAALEAYTAIAAPSRVDETPTLEPPPAPEDLAPPQREEQP